MRARQVAVATMSTAIVEVEDTAALRAVCWFDYILAVDRRRRRRPCLSKLYY